MQSDKLLVICGPTATGKTNLGIKLAQLLNGEIVSADSRQVYQDMDIGTGKNLPPNSSRVVRHTSHGNKTYKVYNLDGIDLWGYDLVTPDQEFSLAHFQQFASTIIPDIHFRGKLPIVVGGTGLYLKSLSHHLETTVIPRDPQLRSQLEQHSVKSLQLQLQQLNPAKLESMNHSDRLNPRRLVRAIEIATYHQHSNSVPMFPDHINSEVGESGNIGIKVTTELSNKLEQLWIGLTGDLSVLDHHVSTNVQTRSKQLDQEINRLLVRHPHFWSFPAATATGYSQWHQFLDGSITRSQATNLWIKSETQYLRRQLTWFKKQPNIHWFDISSPHFQQQVAALVKPWYSKPKS